MQDPHALKRVCGHDIQPSAVPVLERLGVLEEADAAGAFRGRGRVWTRYGWFASAADDDAIDDDAAARRSLSLRREVLDPLLRRTAAATPGVDLLPGHTLVAARASAAGAQAADPVGAKTSGAPSMSRRSPVASSVRTSSSRRARSRTPPR